MVGLEYDLPGVVLVADDHRASRPELIAALTSAIVTAQASLAAQVPPLSDGLCGEQRQVPLERRLQEPRRLEHFPEPRDLDLDVVSARRIQIGVVVLEVEREPELVVRLDTLPRLLPGPAVHGFAERSLHEPRLVRAHLREETGVETRALGLRQDVLELFDEHRLALLLEGECIERLAAARGAHLSVPIHVGHDNPPPPDGCDGAGGLGSGFAYCMVAFVPGILEGRGQLVQNASVAATELIRQAILDGRLEPGSRLKEEELARELGISRTPVREALLVLQAEGLIETTPNRGAVVGSHDADDLIDLYQLRALLEGYAARQAAARVSDEEIGLLRESCDRFDRIAGDDVRELVKENLLFHSAIHAAAGSARLSGMLRRVIELPLVYKSYVWYPPDQKRISAHYHRQITNALSVRDAERAELVMREHVFEARDLLVAASREQVDTP